MKVKSLLFRKSILLILYTLVYIYFAIFNWKVFTIMLNVDLGFGVVRLPPFIIFFLLGFIVIGIMSWSSYVNNLRRTIYELEKGVELGKMKDKLVKNKLEEHLADEKNIGLLQEKLEIPGIREQQEELGTRVSGLAEELKEEISGLKEEISRLKEDLKEKEQERISRKDQNQTDS